MTDDPLFMIPGPTNLPEAVREAVGPDYTLMLDAFMGWSTSYAVVMAQRLAPLPRWQTMVRPRAMSPWRSGKAWLM